MMRWLTPGSTDIVATRRRASYAPTKSRNVSRGKTRNAIRLTAIAASGRLDRGLVALGEGLVALGVRVHPGPARLPADRPATFARRAERGRPAGDLGPRRPQAA